MKRALWIMIFLLFLTGQNILAETLGVKFVDGTETVPGDILSTNLLLGTEPVFKRTVTELQNDREILQSLGKPAPDLTRCFYMDIQADERDNILAELRKHPDVEHAYILPACLVPAGTIAETPDFSEFQEYLYTTEGPNLARAWDYELGTGVGVTIVDIESNCNRNHEELAYKLQASDTIIGGVPGGLPSARDHGTAVAGLLIAEKNDKGITGISHDAGLKLYFCHDIQNLPTAVNQSQAAIETGDIILIEMQTAGPNWTGSPAHIGLVPVEWDYMTRIAIANAVALGRVVIEVAGNGEQDLDWPEYEDVFGPEATDIGSIIVGAAKPATRAASGVTNYGSRVNLQGWALRQTPCCQVWSTGYGNAPDSPSETNREYTHTFSGTSAAAAMVTGAAACVASAGRYRKGSPLTPEELRTALVTTGYPQTGDRHVGPLPDVADAIEFIPYTDVTIDLSLNQPMFGANDFFVLKEKSHNPRSAVLVTRYLALECFGDWFFMDCSGRWLSRFTGCPMSFPPGEINETHLQFVWPEGDFGVVNPGSGCGFHIAYFTLMGEFEMIGNLDSVSFGWTNQ